MAQRGRRSGAEWRGVARRAAPAATRQRLRISSRSVLGGFSQSADAPRRGDYSHCMPAARGGVSSTTDSRFLSRSLALAAYCCYRYRYCCWLLFCCSPLSTSSSTRFRAARSRALQASAIVSKTGKRSVGVDRKFALDPRPTVVLNLLTCSSSASPRLLLLDKGRSGPKTRGSTGFQPCVRMCARARTLRSYIDLPVFLRVRDRSAVTSRRNLSRLQESWRKCVFGTSRRLRSSEDWSTLRTQEFLPVIRGRPVKRLFSDFAASSAVWRPICRSAAQPTHAHLCCLGSLVLVQVPVLCGGVKYTYIFCNYVTSATKTSKGSRSYQRASRMIWARLAGEWDARARDRVARTIPVYRRRCVYSLLLSLPFLTFDSN